jgi:hypothetical protein
LTIACSFLRKSSIALDVKGFATLWRERYPGWNFGRVGDVFDLETG